MQWVVGRRASTHCKASWYGQQIGLNWIVKVAVFLSLLLSSFFLTILYGISTVNF